MNIKNYYLDTKSVFKLDTSNQDRIFNLYQHMMEYIERDPKSQVAESVFNTLTKSGYLKNKDIEERDEKIGDLMHS